MLGLFRAAKHDFVQGLAAGILLENQCIMPENSTNQDSWASRAHNSHYGQYTSRAQLDVIERLNDSDLYRFMVLQNLELQKLLRQIKTYVLIIALPLIVSAIFFVLAVVFGGVLGAAYS